MEKTPSGTSPLSQATPDLIVSGLLCSWSNSLIEKRLLHPGETPVHHVPMATLALNLAQANEVERTINGETSFQKVGPGRICLYPAGTELQVRWKRTHSIVLLGIDEPLMARAAADLQSKSSALKLVPDLNDAEIRELMLQLLDESTREDKSLLRADSLSAALAVHSSRHYSKATFAPMASEGFSSRQSKAIVEFLEHHFAENLNLSDLASNFGLSPFHFLRKFKKTFGVPPHQWMTARRVEGACKMLALGSHSIHEIAYTFGFNSASNFARTFRNRMHCTPKQYREKHRF